MRQMLPAVLLVIVCSAVHPQPVHAWGFNGHRYLTERAIELLPPEIRPFFQAFRTTVVEHSIDPDTYRTVGFIDETPRHFLDMDAYGPFPFSALPHDYKDAVAARGEAFVLKNGTVPWRTQQVYDLLRDAFKQLSTVPYARDNVKLFSSIIAHYVGDSFQPFHAAVNYDGQMTNQHGIHSRFETELFDRYQARLHVVPAATAPVPNAREFVFATLSDSFQNVAPILAADLEAVKGRTVYDDGYFAVMFEKTGPIMEKRLSGAISGIASLITAAWIEAGRPPLPAQAPPSVPRPIRR